MTDIFAIPGLINPEEPTLEEVVEMSLLLWEYREIRKHTGILFRQALRTWGKGKSHSITPGKWNWFQLSLMKVE